MGIPIPKVDSFSYLGERIYLADMTGMGMNAVRIPVPCRVFHDRQRGLSAHGLKAVGYGASQCGAQSNADNLI